MAYRGVLGLRAGLAQSTEQNEPEAAANQLEGITRRDEGNRETAVMSAMNLPRAYRYPQVVAFSEWGSDTGAVP